MTNKPYADDWEQIGTTISSGRYYPVEYSKHKDLYWFQDTVYDEKSARHNGIIGVGSALKSLIAESNSGP